jgi:signal transduction histidine kinase/CheY-like chemotaxis protein
MDIDVLRRQLERERLARKEVEKILEEKSAELCELNQNLKEALFEQEQIARELILKNEQVEAASEAKKGFLANTSHELRTPLNAIIGLSEMLYEDAVEAGDDKYIESLDRINKAGKHLLQIINNILDLSKIESGKLEIFVENIQIKEFLSDLEGFGRTLAEKNHNIFVIKAKGFLDGLQTDSVKLKQILLNLIGNACKFTENGRIILEAQENQGYVIFQVIDSGIGMTEEELKHVFEEFTQADSSITRKYGGTGLGLTITQKLCYLIGGEIFIQSEKQKGTICSVKIPLQMPEAVSTAAIEKIPSFKIKTNCSLVIENDAEVAALIKEVLEEDGFEVFLTDNGEDGLKLADQIKPSLIVLDLYFHDKNQGWHVLNALKSSRSTQNSAILVIGTHKEKNLSFILGASDYVARPVSREHITQILNKHIARDNRLNKIIVIDDDEDTRKQFKRILEKENCQIFEAVDGAAGIKLLQEVTPDLVFLDLLMPRMDGFEFLEIIRKEVTYLAIPIIVITAKSLDAEDYARLAGKTQQILQKGEYTAEGIKQAVKKAIAAAKKSGKNL